MNDRIDTVFDYDTYNDIADILIDEINNITGRLETFGDREVSTIKTAKKKYYYNRVTLKTIKTKKDIKPDYQTNLR